MTPSATTTPLASLTTVPHSKSSKEQVHPRPKSRHETPSGKKGLKKKVLPDEEPALSDLLPLHASSRTDVSMPGVDTAERNLPFVSSASKGHPPHPPTTTAADDVVVTLPPSASSSSSSSSSRRRVWVDEEDAANGAEVAVPRGRGAPNWTIADSAVSGVESDERRATGRLGARPPHHRENDTTPHPHGRSGPQTSLPWSSSSSVGGPEATSFFSASKRFRHDDLDPLLSSTAPLLTDTRGGGKGMTPQILSTIPLPRDTARTVQWHPSGQLLLVSGNHHVYVFHAAGGYVEQLSKIQVSRFGGSRQKGNDGGFGAEREAAQHRQQIEKAMAAAVRGSGGRHRPSASPRAKFVLRSSSPQTPQVTCLQSTTLTATGEDVILTGKDTYTPVQLHIATEQLLPLRFLDTRDTVVHRLSRDETPKAERYITKVASTYNTSGGGRHSSLMSGGGGEGGGLASLLAVASGSMVRLGSLSSGCVTSTITTNDPVTDLHFLPQDAQLYIASGKRVLVYDVRMLGPRFLYEHIDEGAISISSFSVNAQYLAVGSSTGVVSLYARPHGSTTTSGGSSYASRGYTTSWTPLKTFSQLTTSVTGVALGSRNHASDGGGSGSSPLARASSSASTALCYFTGGQKAGFRVAHLSADAPYGVVVPSFPAVSVRHDFIHTISFSPSLPILSVGERQRVVNYAI